MSSAHAHAHPHPHGGHGHSRGLIDQSIERSRAGIRAVPLSLLVTWDSWWTVRGGHFHDH